MTNLFSVSRRQVGAMPTISLGGTDIGVVWDAPSGRRVTMRGLAERFGVPAADVAFEVVPIKGGEVVSLAAADWLAVDAVAAGAGVRCGTVMDVRHLTFPVPAALAVLVDANTDLTHLGRVGRHVLATLGQPCVDAAAEAAAARHVLVEAAGRLRLRSQLVALFGNSGPVSFSSLARLNDLELADTLAIVLRLGATSLRDVFVQLVGDVGDVDGQIADLWAARPGLYRVLSAFRASALAEVLEVVGLEMLGAAVDDPLRFAVREDVPAEARHLVSRTVKTDRVAGAALPLSAWSSEDVTGALADGPAGQVRIVEAFVSSKETAESAPGAYSHLLRFAAVAATDVLLFIVRQPVGPSSAAKSRLAMAAISEATPPRPRGDRR